jgi:hypothetical protein
MKLLAICELQMSVKSGILSFSNKDAIYPSNENKANLTNQAGKTSLLRIDRSTKK